MTPEKLKIFRLELLKRQNELQIKSKTGEDGTKVVELDQQAIGRLSRMDALQHQAMARAGQVRRTQEVQKIAAALSRIEEGEFGYCTDCGEEIGEARLNSDPATPMCFSCAAG